MTTTTTARSLTAAILTIGSLVGGANAALVISFQQVGDDVVASSAGSLEAPSSFSQRGTSSSVEPSVYSGGAYIGEEASPIDIWNGANSGSFSASFARPTSPLDSGFFVGFGLIVNGVTVDSDYEFGDPLISSSTWEGFTLEDLSLGAEDNLTVVYNTASGTDSFTVQVVPEPSSALFGGLGCLSLLLRRSRR